MKLKKAILFLPAAVLLVACSPIKTQSTSDYGSSASETATDSKTDSQADSSTDSKTDSQADSSTDSGTDSASAGDAYIITDGAVYINPAYDGVITEEDISIPDVEDVISSASAP